MKGIRRFLAAIALLATLIGFSLQGAASLANTASNVHFSSLSASSLNAIVLRPVHIHPDGPCPHGGGDDC